MTPQEEVIRAETAKRILQEPLLQEAFAEIVTALLEQWRRSPLTDTAYREQLWALYCGAYKFQEMLTSYMETGKLAWHQINAPVER